MNTPASPYVLGSTDSEHERLPIKLTVAFGARSLSAIRWPSKATASNPIKRMLFVWVDY
jgi:hypothetical protein